MTAKASDRKESRIDLRMTSVQKRRIVEAADLSGMNVSQWTLDRLLDAAQRDIQEAHAFVLSEEAFDEFVRMFDEPQTPEFAALLERRPSWMA